MAHRRARAEAAVRPERGVKPLRLGLVQLALRAHRTGRGKQRLARLGQHMPGACEGGGRGAEQQHLEAGELQRGLGELQVAHLVRSKR
jgi:hypothetical protein